MDSVSRETLSVFLHKRYSYQIVVFSTQATFVSDYRGADMLKNKHLQRSGKKEDFFASLGCYITEKIDGKRLKKRIILVTPKTRCQNRRKNHGPEIAEKSVKAKKSMQNGCFRESKQAEVSGAKGLGW